MKIDQDVLAVLSTMEIDGFLARITEGQLDRQLYERTNAVLLELGGKWNRSKKAHVFTTDPAARFDAAIVSGEVTTAKEIGFFPTPALLAKRLVEMADIQPHHRVLEPSAGSGRIAVAILQCRPKELVLVENDLDHAMSLLSLSVPDVVTVCAIDFLSFAYTEPFDRVVSNPPFARQQDISHVRHAFAMLKSGGRLVSVMSAGTWFRQDRKAREFRSLVVDNGGRIETLPDNSFAESGTKVRTVVVTMEKS